MDFVDTISTDLPAPRDDEPAGLRQDILDELADHLACSYNRELLRGTRPEEARRRVIERFGDPAAVARRLWLDAMKGKIMAQRVLIATCMVMAVACLWIAGLAWSQSSRSAAEVAEANRRLAALLGQTQATNQEMLHQLRAMARPENSAEWIPVQFNLTVDKPDGPPAVGYEIVLGRGHGGSARSEAIHRRTDENGLADFGVVQPGDWEFTIQAGKWNATGSLNAVPGTPVAQTIFVPTVPPHRALVRVRVDWPKPLADKDLIAIAQFRPRPLSYQAPIRWASPHSVQILCGPRSELVDFPSLPVFTPENIESLAPNGARQYDDLLTTTRVYGPFDLDPSIASTEPFELDEGHYLLARLLVLRPAFVEGAVVSRYELMALINPLHGERVTMNSMLGLQELSGSPVRPSWRDKLDRFEARSDHVAEWVISLPEEMVRLAEKKLKAKETPKKPG
jgi:hypothetical protein